MDVSRVSTGFMKLLDEVAEDGELTFNEIRQLAVWINKNKEGRKLWPATVFIKLLQDVFADGKIETSEAHEVAKLIQGVRRQWSRNSVPAEAVPALSAIENAIAGLDIGRANLPIIPVSLSVPSRSEVDIVYTVDFNGPTCTCPDFRSSRNALPSGHLSRCCKHIFDAYAQLKPEDGWPSWLDAFLEMGMRPIPSQEWAVLQIGSAKFLVSSAPRDWGNVYTKSKEGNQRFGYNPNEERWSYGKAPPHAQQLAQAVIKLTNQP